MTPFTDEDLKRLKDVLNSRESPLCIPANRFRAIISRLEAAEKAMMACQNDFCCNIPEYEVWCKVAGK